MSAMGPGSRLPGYASLFACVGTLVCCALPSVLVLVGLGATVASVLSAMPWLVELSRNKDWAFGAAGVLLAGNAYYVYRLSPRLQLARGGCPPGEEEACAAASRTARLLLVASAVLYGVGFIAAYALGPVLTALER